MQSFFSSSNAREIFTHPLNKANEREEMVDKKKNTAHAHTKYLPLLGKMSNCPNACLHPVQF